MTTTFAEHRARFDEYYREYSSRSQPDSEDYEHLHLKWKHSLNVTANAEEILANSEFPENLRRAGMLAALYHDVARFEQYARFGTFRDGLSANHGAWGSKILKYARLLEGESKHTRSLVRAAVSMHNRPDIPGAIPEEYRLITALVRDADKIDILRVVSEYMLPHGPRSDVVTANLPDVPSDWSAEIYNRLLAGRCSRYKDMRVLNDFRLLLCSWLFNLNFSASLKIIAVQGYIPDILAGLPACPEMDDVRELALNVLKTGR